MKKLLLVCFAVASALNMWAQQPDFSCVGFAAENGGTTGGKGGQEVTVTNLEQFKKYVSEKDATPRIIYVKGKLEGAGGGEMVSIGSNKSIIGIGTEAEVLKVQFYCKNSQNLIIQNLYFSMDGSTLGSDADCISVATTGSSKCQNIWIDHCTFDNKLNPIYNASASLKDKYDGLLDIKKNSEYITISWCVFKNHYKGILIGYTSTDTYDRKITMHHNAFINIGSRTPSYRGGTAHIYNNYWDGCYDPAVDKYFSTAVNTREKACLLVESNHFKNINKTVYCAIDDVKEEGFASYRNNMFENSYAETATVCNEFIPPYTVVVEDVNTVHSSVSQHAGVGVISDPSDVPAPEEGGGTGLTSPSLNDAIEITPKGFTINWNAVDNATEYMLNVSRQVATEGNATVFQETFNNFTTSNVTKHGLTSNLTDNSASVFTEINGGTKMVCTEDGTMLLDAGRFCIEGLDLSSSPTLFLKYKYISGKGKLQVAVDVKGTSGAGGMYNVAASATGDDYATLEMPLTGGTSASFIQIRVESSTAIIIDDITISSNGPGSKTETKSYIVAAPNTSLIISDLEAETDYTVEVLASNDTETSSASNVISVTTLSSLTSIENEEVDNKAKISVINNAIVLGENGNYRIYNFSGQLLLQGHSTSDEYIISEVTNSGCYIVSLNGKAQKVYIK